MNKLAKVKLTAELLEAAAEAVRDAAIDKVRWNDDYHLECDDLWDEAKLLSKLTPSGSEVLDVAELLVTRLEALI